MPEPGDLARKLYEAWGKIPHPERYRTRWVLSQATLNELADGALVPSPACVLGLQVRVDDAEPGIRTEQDAPPWASTMTAWMWP